eukprot:7110450-Heterocapsa_arctica.AAC.1
MERLEREIAILGDNLEAVGWTTVEDAEDGPEALSDGESDGNNLWSQFAGTARREAVVPMEML